MTEASLCRAHAGTTDERKLGKKQLFFQAFKSFQPGLVYIGPMLLECASPREHHFALGRVRSSLVGHQIFDLCREGSLGVTHTDHTP